MRRYNVRLVPDGGWFHPFDKVVAGDPDVTRVAIHNMHLINDDVGQTLYEFNGDPDRLESVMESLPCNASYQIDVQDDRIFNYMLFEPNDTIRDLLNVHHNHQIFLDPPQLFTPQGHLQLTYYGTEEPFQEAMDAVPDRISVTLERKSEFTPSQEPFTSKLTTKQREILSVAMDRGYYEVPRETTLADIGRELDLTPATIGEHLQKIEMKLMKTAMGVESTTKRKVAQPH